MKFKTTIFSFFSFFIRYVLLQIYLMTFAGDQVTLNQFTILASTAEFLLSSQLFQFSLKFPNSSDLHDCSKCSNNFSLMLDELKMHWTYSPVDGVKQPPKGCPVYDNNFIQVVRLLLSSSEKSGIRFIAIISKYTLFHRSYYLLVPCMSQINEL